METNLLDRMLSNFCAQKAPVTVVLQNRVRISGTVKAFDSYVILLENEKTEIIYRHAVSSIGPSAAARPARPPRPQVERSKPALPAERPTAPQSARTKGTRQAAAAASAADTNINTGMKDGLLRWMQERKASK